MQETEQLDHNLSSNLKDLKNTTNSFGQKEDEVLGMFLDGVQSAHLDCLEQLNSGRSAVNQLVSDEIKHDVPTGKSFHLDSFYFLYFYFKFMVKNFCVES